MNEMVAEAIEEFVYAKRAKGAAEKDFEKAQERLIAVMGKQKTARLQIEDDECLVTVVRGTRIKRDDDRLKKNLGARVWAKVTKRVVDDRKLEDAITRGEVDATVVAMCCEEVESKPYVKLTERTGVFG